MTDQEIKDVLIELAKTTDLELKGPEWVKDCWDDGGSLRGAWHVQIGDILVACSDTRAGKAVDLAHEQRCRERGANYAMTVPHHWWIRRDATGFYQRSTLAVPVLAGPRLLAVYDDIEAPELLSAMSRTLQVALSGAGRPRCA